MQIIASVEEVSRTHKYFSTKRIALKHRAAETTTGMFLEKIVFRPTPLPP